MTPVFVDTGAWFALADRSDQYHSTATKLFSNLLPSRPLVTSNLVIAETQVLIRRNLGHDAAIRFLVNLNESPRIQKVYSDESLEEMALGILKKFSDQDFSFVDAVSFSIMKKVSIPEVFGFDSHFIVAGFSLLQ